MQVISVESGEAESSDGVHWVLYIIDEDIVSHTGMFEVRYGSWNVKDGLVLSAIRGTVQGHLIESVGEKLIRALERYAKDIPFDPIDNFECWMLTEDELPLVLIDSVLDESEITISESPLWHPGAAPYEALNSAFGDAERLRKIVNHRAGAKPKAIWFKRNPDGSAVAEDGSTVAAFLFPPMLLLQKWDEKNNENLVSDFIHWQAPWLLQLHALSDDERQNLEIHAWKRQILCAGQFRLFVKLMDERALKSVRVQARLMGGGEDGFPVKEAFIDSGDKENYSP